MKYIIRTPLQLSKLIAAARKARGLTQTQLAKKMGMSQQAYARFELQPASASFRRLFAVIRQLEMDISLDIPKSDALSDKKVEGLNTDENLSESDW